MGFWLFMLIVVLLLPITMIYIGRQYTKHTPDHISNTSGYRTAMSMKNKDTWAFAHKYVGRLWQIGGWVLIVPSVIVMAVVMNREINVIGIAGGCVVAVQLLLSICSYIPTEIALKKTFDSAGIRK